MLLAPWAVDSRPQFMVNDTPWWSINIVIKTLPTRSGVYLSIMIVARANWEVDFNIVIKLLKPTSV